MCTVPNLNISTRLTVRIYYIAALQRTNLLDWTDKPLHCSTLPTSWLLIWKISFDKISLCVMKE